MSTINDKIESLPTEGDEYDRKAHLFGDQSIETKFTRPEMMNQNMVTYSKKIKLIKNCPQEQIESISKSLYKLQRLRHRPH